MVWKRRKTSFVVVHCYSWGGSDWLKRYYYINILLFIYPCMHAVAELCKAFGMSVWGVTRTESVCPHVDHHRSA